MPKQTLLQILLFKRCSFWMRRSMCDAPTVNTRFHFFFKFSCELCNLFRFRPKNFWTFWAKNEIFLLCRQPAFNGDDFRWKETPVSYRHDRRKREKEKKRIVISLFVSHSPNHAAYSIRHAACRISHAKHNFFSNVKWLCSRFFTLYGPSKSENTKSSIETKQMLPSRHLHFGMNSRHITHRITTACASHRIPTECEPSNAISHGCVCVMCI